ncbi:hypothetical protein [Streptomyces sp. NPDC057293]|uniref:hypothetical protein n=1 Tax=unclassified Streptomyces TaxID=2593676 RepID=UPI00363B5FA5
MSDDGSKLPFQRPPLQLQTAEIGLEALSRHFEVACRAKCRNHVFLQGALERRRRMDPIVTVMKVWW